MKTENQLKAFARNLIAKGHTEAEALQILADKYPECEGTIFAMDVSVSRDQASPSRHQVGSPGTGRRHG